MSTHQFEISSYKISLGDKITTGFGGRTIMARGIISCRGPGYRIAAYFLSDDSPIPDATTSTQGDWAAIFLPPELMALWIDLLRNERPLYGYINTGIPGLTNLSTSLEPVGESEEM
jgi:hypothetical protein